MTTSFERGYLYAIKDCYSGKIVGYSIDERMKASRAVSALRNAIALRSPTGTIVHSDGGSQFRSKKFVRTLKNNGLLGSMGRAGSARAETTWSQTRENHEPVVSTKAGAVRRDCSHENCQVLVHRTDCVSE